MFMSSNSYKVIALLNPNFCQAKYLLYTRKYGLRVQGLGPIIKHFWWQKADTSPYNICTLIPCFFIRHKAEFILDVKQFFIAVSCMHISIFEVISIY